jgi:uncharacterized protein YkwD
MGMDAIHVFAQRNQYMKVVEPYVQSATIFPDSMYRWYDWSQFEHLEAAHQLIDWSNPDFHLLNAAVFYHTNRFRLQMKKPPLVFSDALRNAALYHAIQMSERGFFGHINPFNKKCGCLNIASKHLEFKLRLMPRISQKNSY